MDRLDFLDPGELLRFYHSTKTQMSCMEKPHTFLRQLRDHGLIPEDKYKIVSNMNGKEKLKKGLYDILDQIETERPQDIPLFWKCVFNNIIMDQYPTLQKLNRSLLDGSYHFKEDLAKRMKEEWTEGKKRKELMEGEEEEEEEESGNEKKKLRTGSTSSDDVGRPGPSTQLPASAVKKEKKKNLDWSSPIYKLQLPVTCGDLEGTLNKDRLAKGKKCILVQKQWFTPTEFEKLAGRQSSRNWKLSIRCDGSPLAKLIQDGHLESVKYKGGCKKANEPPSPSDEAVTDDEEPEDRTEGQQDVDRESDYLVFNLVCADIQFEPETRKNEGEVKREARCQPDGNQDIGLEESPLSDPVEVKLTGSIFRPHTYKYSQVSHEDGNEDELLDDEDGSLSTSSSVEESDSSLKKENSDVGDELPVICGEVEGTLHKDRLAKGLKCILVDRKWFTPSEFEKHAGKKSSKNWKLSIRSEGVPLAKLIQRGALKSVKYKGGCKKTNATLSPSDHEITGEEEAEEAEDHRRSKAVFKVTCGAVSGKLHKKRFASGTHGLSIRTNSKWMTPEEFVKEASCKTDASWRRDIKFKGKPLGALIDREVLKIHPELCECSECEQDPQKLTDERNDDECFVCKSDAESHLVLCEQCPRSFHQRCHLPHIDDADLGDDRPWMCTFCEVKCYNDSEKMEMKAALSQYISRHMLKCQYLLLCRLCSMKSTSTTNLSLENVANKLREYQTVGEFTEDVRLILAKHKQEASRISPLDQFEKAFRKVFNIC